MASSARGISFTRGDNFFDDIEIYIIIIVKFSSRNYRTLYLSIDIAIDVAYLSDITDLWKNNRVLE